LADVFISYARSDVAIARRVAKALAAAGLDVWWDADLPAHRAYSDVIERNLQEAKAVVVLWSKAAAQSQWVRAEADFARNQDKIVQAQLDRALPPLPFNQIQCADLRGWRGARNHAGWTKLRESTKALVSGSDAPVPGRRPSLWDRTEAYRSPVAILFALFLAAGIYIFAFGVPREERKPVLAVLPFRSLDPHDEALATGMWEDTRTAIGRNRQLIVLGPNTAQELAQKGERATRKAADYVLRVSVRAAGDKIRVSTDLVRTRDGAQLWSHDFDRKLDDVFELQSEIASAIEGRIRGRLASKGGRTPENIATTGEVYALYSDARAKFRKRDFGTTMAAAHRELQQVVSMDPNFAPGWATLSEVMAMMPPSERAWRPGVSAEACARKAIDLAPNLAAAHAALAFALHLEGPVARVEVQRAVQLDPSDYEAITWLGNIRKQAGDVKGAAEAYRRAAEIEPFFWPAVFNLYSTLEELGDAAGLKALLDQENRVGADYLAAAVKIDEEVKKGNLAGAVNTGLTYWRNGSEKGLPAVTTATLWTVLLQLGFLDEAAEMGPAPDFAPYLWRNDPKGLDMMESHHVDARSFFSLEPLTENAGRVYLLSGRGRKLADLYLSLKMTPQAYTQLATGDGPQHFLYSAPLIAVALRDNGHAADAQGLLAIAEKKGKASLADGTPRSAALLARIYGAQGRKDQALSLLTGAVNRGWIPEPPDLATDLNYDPALAGLKGDLRFERLRQQILGTIARERAQVNLKLLNQLKTA
jgi:adenylate cyclase